MHSTLAQDQVYIATDILILSAHEGTLYLLLGKRSNPPYAGCWALPGRLIGLNESAEESAGKLLEEMLPVRDAFFEQLYTFTDVNRDPRGRVISVAYLVIVPWRRLEEAMEGEGVLLERFALSLDGGLKLDGRNGQRIDAEHLAFDHRQMIETAVRRLRGKLDYTEIAFEFLDHPGMFSLGELQAVHEAVLGKPVDKSNFRRTVLSRYEETGRIRATEKMDKQRRGRPAVLYSRTDEE